LPGSEIDLSIQGSRAASFVLAPLEEKIQPGDQYDLLVSSLTGTQDWICRNANLTLLLGGSS